MITPLLMALTSILSCSIAAEAHQINLTNARVEIGPDRSVDVEIAMKGSDADLVAGTHVIDQATGLVQPMGLAAASMPILGYVERRTAVLGGNGDSCSPAASSVTPDGDVWHQRADRAHREPHRTIPAAAPQQPDVTPIRQAAAITPRGRQSMRRAR